MGGGREKAGRRKARRGDRRWKEGRKVGRVERAAWKSAEQKK